MKNNHSRDRTPLARAFFLSIYSPKKFKNLHQKDQNNFFRIINCTCFIDYRIKINKFKKQLEIKEKYEKYNVVKYNNNSYDKMTFFSFH